jgi:glycosyltransferase involved in cell wall biosynthesis
LSAATPCSVPGDGGPIDAVPYCLPCEEVRPSPNQERLVTIIVPCYNGEAFLEEAIRSALTQSYAAVEVLVIDDGSTDNSAAIARRFPVRLVQQENRGLSGARNRGVRESTGSYIVFLDADDRLLPEAIEHGLQALEARPDCAMAVGDHVFISSDGSSLGKSGKTGSAGSPYEKLLKSNFIEMISSVLFRRSIFDQVGGFKSALRVAEDYDLYLRIARMWPVCHHAVVVAEYRMHANNTSRNSELMLTTTLGVLKSQMKYVRQDARRLLAFCEGLRSWRRQYGRQLASELAGSFSELRADQVRRKLRVLGSYYPPGLLMFLLLRVLRAIGHWKAALESKTSAPIGAESRFNVSGRRVGDARVRARFDSLPGRMSASTPKQAASIK